MKRRSFLSLAAATAATSFAGLTPASGETSEPAVPIPPVLANHDRTGELHTMGYSKLAYKVLTKDSSGALFMIEHKMTSRGGPPLHMHPHQDEWFYVLEGEYVGEIGGKRYELHAGDSVLAPRTIPHVWAFVGSGAGRLLIAFTPAGKMESFFDVVSATHAPLQDAALFRDHDMVLLGPPLAI